MRVLIESRYRGTPAEIEENKAFVHRVCRFASLNGYNPYASHIFFTQFLDDTIKEERDLGIRLGLEWADFVNEVWVCLREGQTMSEGMKFGIAAHLKAGRDIKFVVEKSDGELCFSPLVSL